MKIIVAFPMEDQQTGLALLDSFKELGHEVTAVDAKTSWFDLAKVGLRVNPELVLCSRSPSLTAGVREIKKSNPKVITCVWNTDTRTSLKEWSFLFDLFRSVDFLFVVAESDEEQMRPINKNTFWLPQGVQERWYHLPGELTAEDVAKYKCDVCFAGLIEGGEKIHGWRPMFLDAVRSIPGIRFKTWGCYGQPKVTGEEHNKMVSLSKINLGMSMCTPEARKYTSVRDYKILAAGGFLLTKYSDKLETWFNLFGNDKMADTYSTPSELVVKVKYWLQHTKEREIVAKNGSVWVKNHRYTDRVKRMLEIVGR